MRLDQFVSQAMGISRSHAQSLIRQGALTLHEQLLKNPSQHIKPHDPIKLEQTLLTLPQPLYLMLNKPAGVVSATTDPHQRTVLDLIQHPHKHTLHVVGRLDKDTTGLLLLSSDGDWSHRIASPRKQIGKTYLVTLAAACNDEALEQLRQGIQLHGEKHPTSPAQVILVSEQQLRLTIYEGMYHQVKRMLAAVGNQVITLHREQIGGLGLDNELAVGEWRVLSDEERDEF
ncbi:pseudouridine synthase [Thiofilum flexile]|uniref:pseudouridine synthase n=1 Tax=Thiofilum flexile TaxID=125627 RepID=UPI000381BB99|nr:pseudouridine synthase [Thiofilum flexile]